MANSDNEVETPFKYTADGTASPSDSQPTVVVTDAQNDPEPTTEISDKPLFSWSAPDSFSKSKSITWYFSLLVITLIIAAGTYLITKDKIATAVMLVAGLLIAVYGSKKPKMVKYQITKYGFSVNGKSYEFGNYRSFSIVHQNNHLSAVLTPLKRFMPYMYIYFGGDIEKQVTSTLADVLPVEMVHRDIIDRFTRKIGF